ncbi:MAG: hypothetical protein AAF456_08580 [Planctomycetota bacterium]
MSWNIESIKDHLNNLVNSSARGDKPEEGTSSSESQESIAVRLQAGIKSATSRIAEYSKNAGEKADEVADTVAKKVTELTGRETSKEDVKAAAKRAAVIGAVIGTAMAARPLISGAMQAQQIHGQASRGASGFFPGIQRDLTAEWEADDLEYDRRYHDNIQDQYNYNEHLDNVAADQMDYNMGLDGY